MKKLPIALAIFVLFGSVASGWWNASWNYSIPIDINTTAALSVTNFPAAISIQTTNTTLWNTTTCTNVRFLDETNTTILNYELDSNSPIFCGNATNNATFWVGVNATGMAITRIYAYLGNTGVASGENAFALWRSANAVGVWHMNDNTTLTDSLGYNNLDAQAACSQSSVISYHGFSTKFDTACWFLKANPIMLPTLNNSHSESMFLTTGSVFAGGMHETVFCYGNSGGTSEEYQCDAIGDLGTAKFFQYTGNDYLSNINTPLAQPYLFGVVYNQTHDTFYWNGTTASSVAHANENLAQNAITIGSYIGSAAHLLRDTNITEVRVYNGTKSVDWEIAEFMQFSKVGNAQTNPCGDLFCDGSETCVTCQVDCGVCVTPEPTGPVAIAPNPANISNTLTTSILPPNVTYQYLCYWHSWNGSLQPISTNCSYFIPSGFNQSRIVVDVYTSNGTAVSTTFITNYTLVYSTTQTTRQEHFVEATISNYYNIWGGFILGIIALGVAFMIAGTISGTSLTAAVLYFAIWVMGRSGFVGMVENPMFLFFAIALVIIGYITKYAGL